VVGTLKETAAILRMHGSRYRILCDDETEDTLYIGDGAELFEGEGCVALTDATARAGTLKVRPLRWRQGARKGVNFSPRLLGGRRVLEGLGVNLIKVPDTNPLDRPTGTLGTQSVRENEDKTGDAAEVDSCGGDERDGDSQVCVIVNVEGHEVTTGASGEAEEQPRVGVG
jgi:hypothetical protein